MTATAVTSRDAWRVDSVSIIILSCNICSGVI